MTGVPFPRKDKNDKACAQLQQEVGDVFHQRGLDVALAGLLTHIQKIEAVRVFQRFARQIGLGFLQAELEVGDGRAAALQQACFDVDVQRIARPAMFDGGLGIGKALFCVFEPGQQHQVVTLAACLT
jgi:hypothetical protein